MCIDCIHTCRLTWCEIDLDLQVQTSTNIHSRHPHSRSFTFYTELSHAPDQGGEVVTPTTPTATGRMHNIMQKSNDCLGGEGAERDVDKIYLGPSTCHSNGSLFGTASERESKRKWAHTRHDDVDWSWCPLESVCCAAASHHSSKVERISIFG